jgi:hypothetical protein
MGKDCAKNCTIAAIRNSDSSRTLSLAILLIVIQSLVTSTTVSPPGTMDARETPSCHGEAFGVSEESYRGNDHAFFKMARGIFLCPPDLSGPRPSA